VAYALRVSSAVPGTAVIEPLAAPGSAPSLSKRGVVASGRRSLRRVELKCGPSPKDVLSGAFEKLRRTASTNSSKRMSSRFARTPGPDRSVGSEEGTDLEDWGWRPVGDVASDVVRNAIVAAALAKGRSS
jgi:hypothetical protein